MLSVFPRPVQDCTRGDSTLATAVRLAECSDCSDCRPLADIDNMQSLNSQFDLLGRLINATEVRHRAISNNLANVNTPNYRRIDVEFEQQLARELSSRSNTGKDTTTAAKPEIVLTPGLTARADGNNVDIDREIGQLNKNAMLQQTYVQLLSTYLDQMRMAIEGR